MNKEIEIKKFLNNSIITFIIGVVGMIVFIFTGLYIIHAILYILLILMGLGWGLTALTLRKTYNKEKEAK